MDPVIVIDQKSEVPAYRQLISAITRLIQDGGLTKGEKLPPERDLAQSTGLSRGTVKKAYEELERDGFVSVIQGSGTYVREMLSLDPDSRKEKAMKLIDSSIQGLLDLGFNLREIRTYAMVKISERENRLRPFNIAGIDCNPETMTIYENQLLYVSRSWMHKFLLSDLRKAADPRALLQGFDLILTTSTHYPEVLEIIPSLKEKLFQAAVATSPETIASLATLGRSSKIALMTHSPRFQKIILHKLKELQLEENLVKTGLFSEALDLVEFLEGVDGVIIPPGASLEGLPNGPAVLPRFREQGGWVLEFSHQIERGSLMYLEEKLSAKLREEG